MYKCRATSGQSRINMKIMSWKIDIEGVHKTGHKQTKTHCDVNMPLDPDDCNILYFLGKLNLTRSL